MQLHEEIRLLHRKRQKGLLSLIWQLRACGMWEVLLFAHGQKYLRRALFGCQEGKRRGKTVFFFLFVI
jgi:hypothetical protein